MTGQLQRRSDGVFETLDGLFAVKLRVVSGVKDDMNWFEYKSSMMAPITRIEWPVGAPFALLPQDEARTLVRFGYANSITEKEMDEYNKAVIAGERTAPVVSPEIQHPEPKPNPAPAWTVPPPEAMAKSEPLPQATPTLVPILPPKDELPLAAHPLKPIATPQ